jgi:hypothetical protein
MCESKEAGHHCRCREAPDRALHRSHTGPKQHGPHGYLPSEVILPLVTFPCLFDDIAAGDTLIELDKCPPSFFRMLAAIAEFDMISSSNAPDRLDFQFAARADHRRSHHDRRRSPEGWLILRVIIAAIMTIVVPFRTGVL